MKQIAKLIRGTASLELENALFLFQSESCLVYNNPNNTQTRLVLIINSLKFTNIRQEFKIATTSTTLSFEEK